MMLEKLLEKQTWASSLLIKNKKETEISNGKDG